MVIVQVICTIACGAKINQRASAAVEISSAVTVASNAGTLSQDLLRAPPAPLSRLRKFLVKDHETVSLDSANTKCKYIMLA